MDRIKDSGSFDWGSTPHGCTTQTAYLLQIGCLFYRKYIRLPRIILIVFFNPSVLRTPPLYFAEQNTGEEFQIPTPKRYVIIRCSKYRYSHFLKNKDGM